MLLDDDHPPEDVAAIAEALVKQAKSGDIPAAKLILDRLGRSAAEDEGTDDESRNRILQFLHEGRPLPQIHGHQS